MHAGVAAAQTALNQSFADAAWVLSGFVLVCPTANLTLDVYPGRFGNATYSVTLVDSGGQACVGDVCGSKVAPSQLLRGMLCYCSRGECWREHRR